MKEDDVICLKCRYEFTTSSLIKDICCPQCNSSELSMHLKLYDGVGVNDCLWGKTKNNNFPSKKKLRCDFIIGSEQRRSDGKWIQKTRTINKTNDNYEEKIIEKETGEIIHECKESLSNHINHGSAKFRKK